jgi:hypothetical protein
MKGVDHTYTLVAITVVLYREIREDESVSPQMIFYYLLKIFCYPFRIFSFTFF